MRILGLSLCSRWLCALALLLSGAVNAADYVDQSSYSPVDGGRFFLLADSAFTPEEEARVRLEAPGRYGFAEYGGVDIRVYQLEKPLEFLKKQKNLHRILVDGKYKGEGLSNTLSYLWENWYKKSRNVMQRVFASDTRQQVTAQVPQLSLENAREAYTSYSAVTQFAPIPGLPVVGEFRYPIWDAKAIAPPADVKMRGSSSNFLEPKEGNVYIPLGKLKPGLYLVEAMVGKHRATTVVFVSRTMVVSKIAGNELMLWTVDKTQEKPAAAATLLWTDGLGVLKQGQSDEQGLLRMAHVSPERSFVLGEDSEGGVFVAENFYYDSEIYDTKLYSFTDRPLYRPGDWVSFKILGRQFLNARDSVPAQGAPIKVTVIDANGSTLQSFDTAFDSVKGAEGRFQLPDNATAGGYELRLFYPTSDGIQQYSSAFRVAEYIKPHFEISMTLNKHEIKTGEPVEGELKLIYFDGRPVVGAKVEISLRSQQLSMVDNELRYAGQFPVQLKTASLETNDEGIIKLDLPAAEKPSRYLLTVFASDGAAYRVKATKEILIERGAGFYQLSAARGFSAAGEVVDFTFTLSGQKHETPAEWEWIRLEDQSRKRMPVTPEQLSAGRFPVNFEQPGNYTLNLLDGNGMLLGATGHSVSGPGVTSVPGTVSIVFARQNYQVGDVAEALVTFPEPVKEALLTLERDKVEAVSLLSKPASWLTLDKINDTQYRIKIPVKAYFAPNLTFSVLYSKDKAYSFQNAGIRIPYPVIDVAISADKEVYRPGETVTVELKTTQAGKAIPAQLTVGVVDEMVYALQAEMAPAIDAFFYHPRRNNVRTTTSLAFISYDIALPAVSAPPPQGNRSERGVKVLERPRRSEVDTASWQPSLQTDAQGQARFTFVMPDSLTRWRITARAINPQGLVGQRTQFIRSEKPVYLKWSGPRQFRQGDVPSLGLLAFNQSAQPVKASLHVTLKNQQVTMPVTLVRGANFLPLSDIRLESGTLNATLTLNDTDKDAISVDLEAQADSWQRQNSQVALIAGLSRSLKLPESATNISVTFDSSPQAVFYTALRKLIDTPRGDVEAISSRLLPLSVAYSFMIKPEQATLRDNVRKDMMDARLRLMQLAGPGADFTWWQSPAGGDAFLTAYAYYADWYASRALNIQLPQENWLPMLDLYSQQAEQLPVLQRALILSFAHDMGLPVKTLLEGLADSLVQDEPDESLDACFRTINMSSLQEGSEEDSGAPDVCPIGQAGNISLVMIGGNSGWGFAAAHVLTAMLAEQEGVLLNDAFNRMLMWAQAKLTLSNEPFVKGLQLYANQLASPQVAELLGEFNDGQATIERALLLTWLRQYWDKTPLPGSDIKLSPGTGWLPVQGPLGDTSWRWEGEGVPASLELNAEPEQAVQAVISWSGADSAVTDMPVNITRKLWRLVPGNGVFRYRLEEVTNGRVNSDDLYLDDVVLTNMGEIPYRYGVLEVALPPGGEIERTTWGIQLTGPEDDKAFVLEKARFEPGQLSYTVPMDMLSGEVRLRHLVRFSQKGTFILPPARYSLMYSPDISVSETAKPDAVTRKMKVE